MALPFLQASLKQRWELVSLYSPNDVVRFLLEMHSNSRLDQGVLSAYDKEFLRHSNSVSVTKVRKI